MSTNAPTVAAVPFVAAAREHQEPAFDVTLTPTTTTQQVLQGAAQALPAEGFLRDVYVQFSASGGTLGSGAISADYPWNIISNVQLSDVNGAPIFGGANFSGYDWFLTNKWGGYLYRGDPMVAPDSNGTSVLAPAFALRVPLEINRQSAFGALSNQNAASSYRLQATMNTIANIYSVAPTTPPNIRLRGAIETWTQPLPRDAVGRPQEVFPPGYGTTQYWSKATYTINGGSQVITLTRVGNLIRAIILVYRAVGGARVTQASGNMPDPIEIDWDARVLRQETEYYRREFMSQTVPSIGAVAGGATAGANIVEDGVLVYNFDRSILGHMGGGSSAFYLPTVQSTRLQINANFPVAGTLDVLTCDIAPVETQQSLRYAQGSATGFHPQVGTPVPGGGA